MPFLLPETIESAIFDSRGIKCDVAFDKSDHPWPHIHISIAGVEVMRSPLNRFNAPEDAANALPQNFNINSNTFETRHSLLKLLQTKTDELVSILTRIRNSDGQEHPIANVPISITEQVLECAKTVFDMDDITVSRVFKSITSGENG